jgi:hypothetical protein
MTVFTEDESARQARAKRLRAEIDAMTGANTPATTPAAEQSASPPIPESPRDFIHRRMQELEEDKTNNN